MLNRIVLLGKINGEPEIRVSAGGTTVTKIKLAVERDYAAQGQTVDQFVVTTFKETAEKAGAIGIGATVSVDGHLQSREWQGQDGDTRTSLEIIGDRVHLIGAVQTTMRPAKPAEKPVEQAEFDPFADA